MRYWLAGLIFLATPIAAQDIHHHEGMSPEVDQFYSTWLRPNGSYPRVSSCCNFLDCYPVEAQFRGGHWFFKHRETQTWRMVPDGLVEHEQADPRESPDGRNHVCASPYGPRLLLHSRQSNLMEALTAAIFYLVIQRPEHPPLQLEHPLPLSECLDETRLALSRNYDIEAGAKIHAGCIVTVAPSIQH